MHLLNFIMLKLKSSIHILLLGWFLNMKVNYQARVFSCYLTQTVDATVFDISSSGVLCANPKHL